MLGRENPANPSFWKDMGSVPRISSRSLCKDFKELCLFMCICVYACECSVHRHQEGVSPPDRVTVVSRPTCWWSLTPIFCKSHMCSLWPSYLSSLWNVILLCICEWGCMHSESQFSPPTMSSRRWTRAVRYMAREFTCWGPWRAWT